MFRIIIDSCGELTEEMKESGLYKSVALTLEVGEDSIIDDETFDQASFLSKVAACPTSPKSACPSPAAYMEAMDCEAENIYIITLSAQLSGSYNSALLAKDLFEEDDESKHIHVFDSKSASIGQTLIGLKVRELEEKGLSFDEVVSQTEAYIALQHTYFCLESLDTLRKAGRLSGLKAMVANTLNIKPVMASTDIGSITQAGQVRGMAKALEKLAQFCVDSVPELERKDRTVAISHCNCEERAIKLKDIIDAMSKFKDIIILNTAGVSSMYAGDGGVIVVV